MHESRNRAQDMCNGGGRKVTCTRNDRIQDMCELNMELMSSIYYQILYASESISDVIQPIKNIIFLGTLTDFCFQLGPNNGTAANRTPTTAAETSL